MKKLFSFLTVTGCLTILASFNIGRQASLTGAWQRQDGTIEEVLTFQDGYFAHTTFDKVNRKFIQTKGGTYSLHGSHMHVSIEFNTTDKESIGKAINYNVGLNNNSLDLPVDGKNAAWKRVDDGSGALAGNWRITGRMNNGEIQQMQRSARKTLKLLSGTRFQWIAINPETKEFFGTGGGTYTFSNGKYTENIEFFSRDSSRVGATLSFEGSVAGNVWTHKGLNSRGEALHEEWSREGQ
jgi:hypothetical protein